jgi:hypothetical protein
VIVDKLWRDILVAWYHYGAVVFKLGTLTIGDTRRHVTEQPGSWNSSDPRTEDLSPKWGADMPETGSIFPQKVQIT